MNFEPNLGLGTSGKPAKTFHGVGIGPLSKILAVKTITGVLIWQNSKVSFPSGGCETIEFFRVYLVTNSKTFATVNMSKLILISVNCMHSSTIYSSFDPFEMKAWKTLFLLMIKDLCLISNSAYNIFIIIQPNYF